jgi:hypothetical protein
VNSPQDACGWCGTPFTEPLWCEYCGIERALAEPFTQQRDRNLDGITEAHRLIARQRRRNQDDGDD